MNLPDTLLEVLKKDGVVAIASLGPDGPHMVNTWNSYVRVSEDGRLLIPAGYFHKTETNITVNNRVLVTLAARGATDYFPTYFPAEGNGLSCKPRGVGGAMVEVVRALVPEKVDEALTGA